MKNMKKILALVVAALMIVASMSVAFAVDHADNDTHSVTITPNNTVTPHTYQAYQIFKGVREGAVSETADITNLDAVKLNSIQWGDNVDGAKFLTALKASADLKTGDAFDFADCQDAADVAAVLATYASDDAKMRAVAALIGDSTKQILKGEPKEANASAGAAVTISGLADGYYFFQDKATTQDGQSGSYSRFMLRVVGDTQITAKDVLPDITKAIRKQNGQTVEKVNLSNENIGDEVEYEIDGIVPNMDGYKTYWYEIQDTMESGLTFNDNIVVKIGDDTLTEVVKIDGKYYAKADVEENGQPKSDATETKTKAYVVTKGTAPTFSIYFVNFIQYNNTTDIGKPITVTYSATINQDAEITATDADISNDNTVKLVYSNNPNQSNGGDNEEPDSTNPKGEGPEHKVRTYVAAIELTKVDGQDTTKKLAGANFTLTGETVNVTIANNEMFVVDATGTYYLLKDGTYTETEAGSIVDGKTVSADDYVSTQIKYKKITVVTKDYNTSATDIAAATSGATGLVNFTGLGEGLYTVTETKAPVGYNLLAHPIYVYVKFVEDADGKGHFAAYQYLGDSSSAPTVSATETFSDTAKWKSLSATKTDNKFHFDFTVENNSGTTLPSTGGMGTTLFYIGGSILVLAAVILLITKRRMSANND